MRVYIGSLKNVGTCFVQRLCHFILNLPAGLFVSYILTLLFQNLTFRPNSKTQSYKSVF